MTVSAVRPAETPEGVVQRASAAALTALGVVVLVVGWWGGVRLARQVHPAMASMASNTALGIILLGAALLPPGATSRRRLARALAAAAAAIGGVTLAEYLFDLDLGIDGLLAGGTAGPDRMAATTALMLLLLGVAVVIARRASRSVALRVTVWGLTAVAAAVSLLVFLVHVLDASTSQRASIGSAMELHTSIAFIVAAGAVTMLMASVGEAGVLRSDRAGGQSVRRLAPVTVVALITTSVVVRLLGGPGGVEDIGLQLAMLSTLSIVVVVTVIVASGDRLDRAEAVAESMEREAVTSQQDLDRILRVFPDVHYRVDADGLITAIRHGDGAADPLAKVGERLASIASPEAAQEVELALRLARDGGRKAEVTFAQGEQMLEARFLPLGDGELAAAVRDVSDLARANEELEELALSLEERVRSRTAELQRSYDEVSAFAHTVAHDLKSPIAGIVGMLDLLVTRADELDDATRADLLGRSRTSAGRLAELVDGLLAFAETTHTEESVSRVEASEVADWVTQVLADDIRLAGATVSREELPAVMAVTGGLRHVLLNLVSNALKYRSPSRPLRIAIGSSREHGTVTIAVTDNGVGIPEDQRSRVFDIGTRLSKDVGGFGLGLPAVKRAIEAMDGSIDIVDGPDEIGTCVRIRLPAA